ncbi:MAG: hypothetical protein ACPG49_04590 [Chitinophagales bacterium]
MKTLIFCLLALGLSLGVTNVNAASRLSPSDIKDKIEEAINHHAGDDGWAEMDKVEDYLKDAGVKVGKMSKFMNKYKKLIKKGHRGPKDNPVDLVRLR